MPLDSERDHSFGTSFFFCVFFGRSPKSVCHFLQKTRRWQCFDAYSRVCMSLGVPWPMSCLHQPPKLTTGDGWFTGNQRQVRHMLQSINYYLLGLCNSLWKNGRAFGNLTMAFLAWCDFRMHIYIYLYSRYRWWRWVRAKLQQFSVCATFPKKIKRFSAVAIDLDALEGMVQSYTPDVGLVLTMIFQVNVKGFFDVIS